jgi:spermidine/putrescine transport system substrate-binding protein
MLVIKNTLKLLLLCIALLALPINSTIADHNNKEIVLLIWAEYMDPQLLEEFEKETGIRVKEIYYDSDTDRDDILLRSNGEGFDMVLVNGSTIESYRKHNWLAEINKKDVPNLEHIDRKWIDAFPDTQGYSIPYFWGTIGIGYRKDLVGREVSSWMELFKPEKKLQGKIQMLEDSRDLFGMALKALGHSLNSSSKDEVRQAVALLKAQQPYVKSYSYPPLGEDSPLVTGEIAMASLYSGDALLLQTHNDNIEFVLPNEGGNLWVDYIVIMENSKHKQEAMRFINYINKPEHAAQLAEFVYYATPNKAAEKLMPEEFLENSVIYPDSKKMKNSEFIRPIVPRIHKLMNQTTSELTR